MNVAEVFRAEITRRLPQSTVDVDRDRDGKLVLTVTSETFTRVRPIDREGRVYEALDKVPLEALARVGRIVCQVGPS